MRSRFRPSPAMVVACLALFVALGGTAMAAFVVSSNSQIGPGTIYGHNAPAGKNKNVVAGSINGADIADRTVDTCQTPLTKKFGPICAGSDAGARTWLEAYDYCRNLGLRLPSIGEAAALATKYDVPGVAPAEAFWTDGFWDNSSGERAVRVYEDGTAGLISAGVQSRTVCVTDPSA